MPTNKSLVEIQQAMTALQANFWTTLGLKSAQFTEAAQQLAQGDKTVLPAIIRLAHQLAGSCGTFQFQHLGHLARQIEVHAISAHRAQLAEPHILEPLVEAIERFVAEVSQGAAEPAFQIENQLSQPLKRQDIWLVLASSALRDELNAQLHAFGYQITIFDTFPECVSALRKQAPALLFSAVTLANQSLFSQYELLQSVNEKQSWLMIFSEEDSFEIRIEGVRHKAQGCFVSPLDIPSMLQRISKLFDENTFSDKKVSILDDDLLLAEHYSWVLKSAGFEVQVIRDPAQIIAELVAFKPDVLLLDMHMPAFSGAEISGVIRQYDSLNSLHITFLSAEHDIQQQLQALSFGADDFITKPISDDNLVTSVKLRLARNREIKSLIERDSLTGLVKHAAIKEAVMIEFDRMSRSGEHFCIAMVDLDHFKQVNDNHGHAMGDTVISTIAALLSKRLRRSDRAGRYGGEEFLVVLPKCSAEDAKLLLDNILVSFREIHFGSGLQHFSCTFSAGIVSSIGKYANAEIMMNAADEVLYQAKHQGRNQVRIMTDNVVVD
ncbi:MAG: diguanylate cyclase [Alishewanella sp.]|nr:diguanylate cyclase [Alishewanella sp.]